MTSLKRKKDLINRKFMEYFVPTVLTAMATNIAVMVDATIVGNLLGSASLAAVNLLSPVVQLYFSLSILFGLSSSTIIARMKGQEGSNEKESNTLFTTTTVVLIILSVLIMAIQFIFIDNIVGAITPNAELRVLVKHYYIPFIVGTPVTLLMTSGIHLIRTDGRPKFASNIIILSNVINLVMDFVTIKGFGMDVTGASVATITGNLVGFIVMLTHFRRADNTLHFDFSVLKDPKLFGKQFIELNAIGISGALGTLLITVRMVFLNTIIQQYGGKSAIVAYSVVSMCQIFVSAFITGASQTMIPIVSMLLGEGDTQGIKFAFRRTGKILLISSIAITLLAELVPGFIAGLYGLKTPQDLAMGIDAVRISSLLFPAMALTSLGLYYFMSIGQKAMATATSIVNGVVLIIPFGILLSILMGITGIWLSLDVAQYGALVFVLLIALIAKVKGKHKTIYLLNENDNKEVMSFSIDSKNTNLDLVYNSVLENTNSETADILNKIIEKINSAEFEKRYKVNHSDVRICKDKGYTVIIKNSGAAVDESTFSNICSNGNLSYSKALGFNQIRFSD